MKKKYIFLVIFYLITNCIVNAATSFTERPIDWELFQALEYGIDIGPILKKGANVDALCLSYVDSIFAGDSPWTFALRRSRPSVIAELAKYKKDTGNISNELQVEIFAAAIYTAEKGNPNYSTDRIKLILNYGLDVNSIQIENSKRKWRTSNDGLSPLMIAVTSNRMDVASLLLDKGAQVNLKNRDGKTVLNFSKTAEMTQLLIDHGAVVENKELTDRTILIEAILNGREEVVFTILNSKIRPDLKSLNEALLVAARVKGQTTNKNAHIASAKIVEELIKFGADPNTQAIPRNSRGTPLLEAVYSNNREVVQVLLKNKANPLTTKNLNSGSLLALAIQQSDSEIVKMLWPYYQPMSNDLEKELISTAGTYGKTESLKLMTDLGFDWNKKSKESLEVLYRSIEKSDVANVKLLLNLGIDPNQKVFGSINLLVRAIHIGNIEIVDNLIEKKAQVNQIISNDLNVETPLRAAVASGNLEIFHLLIKNGANLKGEGRDEYLIHFLPTYKISVSQKSEKNLISDLLKILDILLRNGSNVDIVDNEGRTILSKLAFQGIPELVKKLVQANATINFIPSNCSNPNTMFKGIEPIAAVGDKGDAGAKVSNRIAVNSEQVFNQYCQTPIALAVLSNNLENAKVLLEGHADINLSSNYNGMTPLMNAAMIGNPEIVSWLIKNKANTKLKNKAGQTAGDIAKLRENTRAMDLINKNSI